MSHELAEKVLKRCSDASYRTYLSAKETTYCCGLNEYQSPIGPLCVCRSTWNTESAHDGDVFTFVLDLRPKEHGWLAVLRNDKQV